MAMLQSGAQHSEGLVLLISVASSLLGLAVMLACLFAGHDRILRTHEADAMRATEPPGGAGDTAG
jgi:hypothetical protein